MDSDINRLESAQSLQDDAGYLTKRLPRRFSLGRLLLVVTTLALLLNYWRASNDRFHREYFTLSEFVTKINSEIPTHWRALIEPVQVADLRRFVLGNPRMSQIVPDEYIHRSAKLRCKWPNDVDDNKIRQIVCHLRVPIRGGGLEIRIEGLFRKKQPLRNSIVPRNPVNEPTYEADGQ